MGYSTISNWLVIIKHFYDRKKFYILYLIIRFSSPVSLEAGIDGVSQWQSLSEDAPSARTEFVYNIDELSGLWAIRFVVSNCIFIKPLYIFIKWIVFIFTTVSCR